MTVETATSCFVGVGAWLVVGMLIAMTAFAFGEDLDDDDVRKIIVCWPFAFAALVLGSLVLIPLWFATAVARRAGTSLRRGRSGATLILFILASVMTIATACSDCDDDTVVIRDLIGAARCKP